MHLQDGEAFHCKRETDNNFDPLVVAVVWDGEIIVHMPRLISAAASQILQHEDFTGSWQYSRNLSQGGLEIPCQLIFKDNEKEFTIWY